MPDCEGNVEKLSLGSADGTVEIVECCEEDDGTGGGPLFDDLENSVWFGLI